MSETELQELLEEHNELARIAAELGCDHHERTHAFEHREAAIAELNVLDKSLYEAVSKILDTSPHINETEGLSAPQLLTLYENLRAEAVNLGIDCPVIDTLVDRDDGLWHCQLTRARIIHKLVATEIAATAEFNANGPVAQTMDDNLWPPPFEESAVTPVTYESGQESPQRVWDDDGSVSVVHTPDEEEKLTEEQEEELLKGVEHVATSAPPKKPGKPRGRPRKNPVEAVQATTDNVPRKRGRPLGSRNKKAADSTENPRKLLGQQEPVKVSKRLGRPRKSNGTETKTQRAVALMKREGGATYAEILAETGWTAVSIPGLARKQGVQLRMVKDLGSVTVYYAS